MWIIQVVAGAALFLGGLYVGHLYYADALAAAEKELVDLRSDLKAAVAVAEKTAVGLEAKAAAEVSKVVAAIRKLL